MGALGALGIAMALAQGDPSMGGGQRQLLAMSDTVSNIVEDAGGFVTDVATQYSITVVPALAITMVMPKSVQQHYDGR